MTIRNRDQFDRSLAAGFDGVFDWDFLNPCWPGKIQPTDIDAVVEINGHFLHFETKNGGPLFERVPIGQRGVIVKMMQCMGPRLTYILLNGKTANTLREILWMRYRGFGSWLIRRRQGSSDILQSQLITMCSKWVKCTKEDHLLPLRSIPVKWTEESLPDDWKKWLLPSARTRKYNDYE